MEQRTLPPGFISVDEAIALIKSHTKENPVIDLLFLVDNAGRIKTAHNFTIKRVKRGIDKKTKKEEWVEDDPVFVTIWRDLERELLREAVKKKYAEFTGQALNIAELGLKSVTTTIDDEGNATGKFRINKESNIKLHDTIQSGAQLTTNK